MPGREFASAPVSIHSLVPIAIGHCHGLEYAALEWRSCLASDLAGREERHYFYYYYYYSQLFVLVQSQKCHENIEFNGQHQGNFHDDDERCRMMIDAWTSS